MDITINHVKNVLNTLPIGYYLGRNIKVELSEGDSSYFDPFHDSITIGYASITTMLKNIHNTSYSFDLEEVIRGLLYHELSHVILTPDAMFDTAYDNFKNMNVKLVHDVMNIFEDERIETLLKDMYMNTNFKKNLIILNNYTKNIPPKSAITAFFDVVRFHEGKPEYVNRVGTIISRYSKINASYGKSDHYNCYDELNQIKLYVKAVMGLYFDVASDFENQKDDPNNQSMDDPNGQNTDNNSSNSDSNDTNSSDNSSSNMDESSSNTDESSSSNDSSDDNDSSSSSSSDNSYADEKSESEQEEIDGIILSDEDVKDLVNEVFTTLSDHDINSIVDAAVASVIYEFHDIKLTENLKRIIDNKLKQKNKNGSAINAYSGRFNPRAVANRDDYKWWVQQNRAGHVRQFSKVHFNLIIDNSGSFEENDENMNIFINALNSIVSNDFDFDVITYNTQANEWADTHQVFHSYGGTKLGDDIGNILSRHQRPQANNYNVVLFDGDADPVEFLDGTNAFKYFNSVNSIIVTDKSNAKYLERVNQARVVIISSQYCETFIDQILSLLENTL